uniref:U-box domain-containing protein n=1 Tax=Craspedostauros australis TaxID=1486917 RepID=A0A7S0F7D3_9STRA|mmetsp:Transcript_9458/g.25677  ORF Transcript_9458/g.25677 Transcript_9458/m.25677 type:complete len:244 (+) Transcript_9458:2-733(+)
MNSSGVDHGNAPHNERERGSDQDADTPDEFICPLTLELMNDPLMDRMGINFEREAIMEWLNRGNNSCPLTRKPLSYSKLVPNAQLRLKIDQWKKSHNIPVVRNTFPAKIQNLGGTFDVADKSSSLEGYHAWQDRQLRLRMMEAVAFDAVAQVSGGNGCTNRRRRQQHSQSRSQPEPQTPRNGQRQSRSISTMGRSLLGGRPSQRRGSTSMNFPESPQSSGSRRRQMVTILDSALAVVGMHHES